MSFIKYLFEIQMDGISEIRKLCS